MRLAQENSDYEWLIPRRVICDRADVNEQMRRNFETWRPWPGRMAPFLVKDSVSGDVSVRTASYHWPNRKFKPAAGESFVSGSVFWLCQILETACEFYEIVRIVCPAVKKMIEHYRFWTLRHSGLLELPPSFAVHGEIAIIVAARRIGRGPAPNRALGEEVV